MPFAGYLYEDTMDLWIALEKHSSYILHYTLRQLSRLSAKEQILLHDRLCIGAIYTRSTSFNIEIGIGGIWEMFYASIDGNTGELCSASTMRGRKVKI